ncbi:MAG: hypothetical protein AAGM22_09905 [Acidobacteriota bacterium]
MPFSPRLLVPAAFFALLLPALQPLHGDDLCGDLDRADGRAADLACVERWLDIEQSWPAGAKAAAGRALDSLSAEADGLTPIDFYVRLAALMALADNGHTALSVLPIYDDFGLLPIRTYWFEDGLHIIRATGEHGDLLGARIVSLAGRSPEDWPAVLASYVGGPPESFRALNHTEWLLSPAVLHAIGASPDPKRLTIEVIPAGPGAQSREVTLSPYETEERHPASYPRHQLHPDPLPREHTPWKTWLRPDGDIPWAFDEPRQLFRYRYLADLGVAHVQFRANNSNSTSDLKAFLKTLKRRFEADRPSHIIWDQRHNVGGNLMKTADFARRLHRWLPKDGHVYTLTSGATFSAGLYTAFFPKWAEPGRTTVVGSLAGDREQFWAESKGPMTLPAAGWALLYSTGYHDLADGCHDRSRCEIKRSKLNLAVGSFKPELEVPERFADLRDGRDAAVDAVLEHIRTGEPKR